MLSRFQYLRPHLATIMVASLWASIAIAQGPEPTLPSLPTPGPRARPTMPAEVEPAPAQPAPRDAEVRPVESAEPPADTGPLPPAATKPGTPAAPGVPPDLPDGHIPVDGIPIGKQTAGMTVEVVAPPVMLVNQPAMIKIVVRNSGVADARAVRVNYKLPAELSLVNAQPQEKRIDANDPNLQFVLNTVAAGSEQIIVLRVKPIQVNTIDHTALVTMIVGARSQTVVQEPMLKVEQSVSPSKVLQGQQVTFRIVVRNPGSGPARNVLVRAKLSTGLKCEGEEIVEQTIPVIPAKDRVELDPLVVDTYAGGEQTCTVTAMSDDVVTPSADAKASRSVVVLRPELAVQIVGPKARYTDSLAEYSVNVDNPGTAAAKNVRVTVTLPPNHGRLQKPLPAGAEWNATNNRLVWTIANIEPKAKASAKFIVRLNGIGAYRVAAEARTGALYQTDALMTDVSGIADIEMNITERKRVLDVGENAIFDIKLKNLGTKPARNILLRAKLSPNIKPTYTAGLEDDAQPYIDPASGELVFGKIDSLAPGSELVISLKAKATEGGDASCRAFLLHDDIADVTARLEDVAHTRVMK